RRPAPVLDNSFLNQCFVALDIGIITTFTEKLLLFLKCGFQSFQSFTLLLFTFFPFSFRLPFFFFLFLFTLLLGFCFSFCLPGLLGLLFFQPRFFCLGLGFLFFFFLHPFCFSLLALLLLLTFALLLLFALCFQYLRLRLLRSGFGFGGHIDKRRLNVMRLVYRFLGFALQPVASNQNQQGHVQRYTEQDRYCKKSVELHRYLAGRLCNQADR